MVAGQPGDSVDDARHPALGVVNAEVEVDVAHQRVERGGVVRRPAEEDQRVLDELFQLRVIEVRPDVVVHRPEEGDAASRPQQAGIDPVAESRPALVDELLHTDFVGVGGVGEIAVECVARPRLVGLEERPLTGAIRGNRGAVAVFPEHAVVRIEPGQRVVRLGVAAEPPEEPLEHFGHQVPRRAGVELEAVALHPSGDAAEAVAPFDDRHVGPGVGEVTGGREAAEAGTDHSDRFGVEVCPLHGVSPAMPSPAPFRVGPKRG